MPLTRGETLIGLELPVTFVGCGEIKVPEESYTFTVYPVIADPFAVGAVKEIDAPALLTVAAIFVGDAGAAAGVILAEAAVAADVPAAFVAVAVNV